MPNSPGTSDPYGQLREVSHEHVYEVWQAAKLGRFEGDDAQLVQAMRDHPEYYDVWEHANEFSQGPIEIQGVNPLLHVVMHTVIENQAAQNNPPEVRAVLEFKMSQRRPRHQVVHEIASEFTQVLRRTLHDLEPFDNEAYRKRLDKLLPRSRRFRK